MTRRFKMAAALASLALVTITLRCLWLWQPERQLILHQRSLRDAIEDRNWNRLSALIDPGYSDRWGYTRQTGVAEARQWLGQFFALTISPSETKLNLEPGSGAMSETWKMEGTGTAAASMVKDRVNAVTTPFTFHWRRRGWKPWDWTLDRVDNASLDLSDPGM